MEKTLRFQQMTRPTQKTGRRRETGGTKAEREEREGRGARSQRKDMKKRGEEKIADKV